MAIAISVVLLVLTVAGVLLGVYWDSIKNAINGTVTYTYEDVQNAYNQGLNDGVANEDSLLAQIEDFKNQVEQLQIDLDYYKELAEENPELKEYITQLQLQIEQLNATIKYYEDLLDEGDQNLVFVNFYLEDTLVKSVAVKAGELIPQSEIPTSYNGLNISSWLNGADIVDFNTFVVNETTDFKANVEYVSVIYIVDNEIYATNKTIKDYKLTNLPESPNKNFLNFIGWTYNDELIDTSTFVVKEDMTLVAKFESYLNGSYTFKLDLVSRLGIFQDVSLNRIVTFDLNVKDITNVTESLEIQNLSLGDNIEGLTIEIVDNKLSITLIFDPIGSSMLHVDSITFNFDRLQNNWNYADFTVEGNGTQGVNITINNISLEQQ